MKLTPGPDQSDSDSAGARAAQASFGCPRASPTHLLLPTPHLPSPLRLQGRPFCRSDYGPVESAAPEGLPREQHHARRACRATEHPLDTYEAATLRHAALLRQSVRAHAPISTRLAQNGILFNHFRPQSPPCGPSRSGFLAGRYRRTTRMRRKGQNIPTRLRDTVAHWPNLNLSGIS